MVYKIRQAFDSIPGQYQFLLRDPQAHASRGMARQIYNPDAWGEFLPVTYWREPGSEQVDMGQGNKRVIGLLKSAGRNILQLRP
jgi:hypothetical protein